jgi:hypothetical protein
MNALKERKVTRSSATFGDDCFKPLRPVPTGGGCSACPWWPWRRQTPHRTSGDDPANPALGAENPTPSIRGKGGAWGPGAYPRGNAHGGGMASILAHKAGWRALFGRYAPSSTKSNFPLTGLSWTCARIPYLSPRGKPIGAAGCLRNYDRRRQRFSSPSFLAR